jgi:hypothetical protein
MSIFYAHNTYAGREPVTAELDLGAEPKSQHAMWTQLFTHSLHARVGVVTALSPCMGAVAALSNRDFQPRRGLAPTYVIVSGGD